MPRFLSMPHCPSHHSPFPPKDPETEERLRREEEERASKKAAGGGKAKATNLLDPKVLQNVGIALAKFRLPIADIRAAVLALDEDVLSIDMVRDH